MSGERPTREAIEALDPRIRRSRRMLHDALTSLMLTKDFANISIQDLAEASTLNRATFYDHYPDKFALLECVVGERFGELMAKRNIAIASCDGALGAIALGVCDYLSEMKASPRKAHEGSMQTAIVGVIRKMLLEGLSDRLFDDTLTPDVVASTLSWSIYGAAKAWVDAPARCPAEDMSRIIDRLIKPILETAART